MNKHVLSERLATEAVNALIREANTGPKPGLVDCYNNGAHKDLTLEKMFKSANSLYDTFYEIAYCSYQQTPNQSLREQIGAIGRKGEEKMLLATDGSNAHKGAIWSLGILVAAASILQQVKQVEDCFTCAAKLANIEDRFSIQMTTHGIAIKKRYGIPGAKEEAQQGFPHITRYSLPAYIRYESHYYRDVICLLYLIAHLNDTCLIHRGGLEGLHYTQSYAKQLIQKEEWNLSSLSLMNENFVLRNLSPGGSADLLAATFFVTSIVKPI